MNAREEAFERLDGAYEARVLEPSPPAVAEDPWFADDPVARGEPTPGRHVVSPVGTGDLRWDDLAKDDPDLAEFCAERWLGAFRRLQPLPETFAGTRTRLHEVAENVLAPARQRENGKIGLRFTRHGFGTPFFGDDLQLRVEGQWLVTQTRDGAERDRIEGVDERAALALGAWFGFAASVLEEIRAEASAEDSPGRVQIWPEHFDASVDLGDEAAGLRAGCGASPGDEEHPEPYLYVQPWTARPTGELWQATGFTGAELPYSALLAADDQREAALDFIRTRLRALADNSTKEQP